MIFPNSKRLICAWHLQRNFASKFSSLATKNKALYDEALNLPFITHCDKFEETVTKLKSNNVLSETQLKYLEEKLIQKKHWAKSENLGTFVVGVSTTSRIESMYSILREKLNSNSRLCGVFEAFKDIEKTEVLNLMKEFERHKKNLNNNLSGGPLMNLIAKDYCPYIMKKLDQIMKKSINYKAQSTSNNTW